MDYCLACLGELGRKQVISCTKCSCKVHRLCNTGISQTEYQRMRRGEITIKFVCTACQEPSTSGDVAHTTTTHADASSGGSYGLRGAGQRRKPSRFAELSPPPKSKKPRKKRESTRPQSSQKPSKKKTTRKQPATPEKEEPLPDWYFYSPPPMRHVYTEEKDGNTISYFDDPEPAPGMPFNPIYRYKYPQLKKTKRIWVQTNRSLFDTTPSSSADPVFKVPTQSVIKLSDPKGKRKADDREPFCSTETGSAAKRQRTECSATIGRLSAVTNSSLKNGMSMTLNCLNQPSDDVSRKRNADKMESTAEDTNIGRSSTETQKVKKPRVDFRLDNSDLQLSFVSSSSVNQSSVDHSFQSFQSVSDIFNLSSGNEMNKTRDSIGIDASFNRSYNRSFNNSFSHLAELI